MADRNLNRSKDHRQDPARGKEESVYGPGDMDLKRLLAEREQTAKTNLKAWIEWFQRAYPSRAPTRTALAKELDITGGAVTQLLNAQANRGPSLRTLIAVKRMLGDSFTIDQILFTPPPESNSGPPVTGRGKR